MMSQHFNNDNVQESNNIPLLELDTINRSPIHFQSDTKTDSSDANESLHKNTNKNNPPKSPPILFSRLYRKKRLKQSRLEFYPMKNNEKILSSSVDKHKAANILRSVEKINCLSPIKIHNKTDIQIKKSIEAQKEDELLIDKIKKDKVLIPNINDFACEDETVYLPTSCKY